MESIGQQLKAAREAKGYSLHKVAEKTRILIQILEDMEQDNYQRIPAPTYARGFIKLYAETVGLDPEPLLLLYKTQSAEAKEQELLKKQNQKTFRKPDFKMPDWQSALTGKPDLEKIKSFFNTPEIKPGTVKTAAIITGSIVLLLIVFSTASRCSAAKKETETSDAYPVMEETLIKEPAPVYLAEPGKIK